MNDYILLVISFVFNFFVPGYVLVQLIFKKESFLNKFAFYLFFSVILSTNFIYLLSLLLGFSSTTIYLSYFIWSILFLCVIYKNKYKEKPFERNNIYPILLSILIFIIYAFVLSKSIFYSYKNYYVMSADNWQDTALHMSIIESLGQGNFPPQAPYYSGEKLTYHYFTDFHTSILTKPLNKFYPRILVFDNSMFALIFAMSMYVLTRYITKSNMSGILSMIISLYSGSFIYIKLIQDWISDNLPIKELILSGSYVLEYGKLFQMAPITNYFLQNRPMMVGMSAIAISLYLIISGVKEKNNINIVFAVVVGLLTINFQIISSLVIFLCILIAYCIHNFKKIYLFLPSLLLIFFLRKYTLLFFNNFEIGAWVDNKNIYWFTKFVFLNLGFPFILSVLYLIILFIKKIKISFEYKLLFILALFLISTPLIVTFTIDKADMLKFFYISYIPLCVISASYFYRLNNTKVGKVLIAIFILLSIPTGAIDLAGSYLNKNLGYTEEDLRVGLWVRENTKQLSVFSSSPSVHNPASDIAGRLRVLSYTNWPYTHGYNQGVDNVFSRQSDINELYKNGDDYHLFASIIAKYNINYIYYGQDELADFPEAKNKLESNSQLEKVYDDEKNIKIYKTIQK